MSLEKIPKFARISVVSNIFPRLIPINGQCWLDSDYLSKSLINEDSTELEQLTVEVKDNYPKRHTCDCQRIIKWPLGKTDETFKYLYKNNPNL